MRLDGYVRVSDVRGRAGESFISPGAQRDKIEGYARLRGHTIVQVWEELDQSGGRMDRPLFQRMLRRVKTGETDGVIVARIDRFARNLTGSLAAIDEIEKAGGQLIAVDQQFDTTTPMGRAMMSISLVFAQLTRDQIAENWRTASASAVARGIHVTPRVPLGYTRAGRGQPFQVDPVAGPIIRELFEQRARGVTVTELADQLTAHGVPTTYGNPHWVGSVVGRLLRNRVYLGEARGHAGITNPGAHEPLVDEELFLRANAQARRLAPRRSKTLLAGIARCAGCRYALTSNGTRYACKHVHAAGRCPAPATSRNHVLEEHVEREFLRTVGELRALVAPRGVDLTVLRARRDRAEQELAAWRDDTDILAVDRDTYLQGLTERVRRRDEARAELANAAGVDAPDLPPAQELVGMWPGLGVDERRHLLASAIDVVFLRSGRLPIGDRVLILWRGQGPADLPRRAKVTALRSFVFPDDDDSAAGE